MARLDFVCKVFALIFPYFKGPWLEEIALGSFPVESTAKMTENDRVQRRRQWIREVGESYGKHTSVSLHQSYLTPSSINFKPRHTLPAKRYKLHKDKNAKEL